MKLKMASTEIYIFLLKAQCFKFSVSTFIRQSSHLLASSTENDIEFVLTGKYCLDSNKWCSSVWIHRGRIFWDVSQYSDAAFSSVDLHPSMLLESFTIYSGVAILCMDLTRCENLSSHWDFSIHTSCNQILVLTVQTEHITSWFDINLCNNPMQLCRPFYPLEKNKSLFKNCFFLFSL